MQAEWIPVSSSMLSAVAYEDGTLHARYKNGRVYSHPGVPESTFQGLLKSSSKGEFFNKHIKPNHPAGK